MKINSRGMLVFLIVIVFFSLELAEILAGLLLLERGDRMAFFGITFSAAITAALCTVIFIHLSRKPLVELIRGIQKLIEENFPDRFRSSTSEDNRELHKIVGCMVSTLKDQEKKIVEMKKQIDETQRLSTLGQLAAGVAHEVNNPLGGIVVYSHLLREDTPPDDPRFSNIEKIIKESNRCKNIVKSLLDFARQSHPVFNSVNVNGIVIEALNNIRREQIFENITVTENFDENLPPVLADASQIQEVFENIIRNAAEVLNGSGEIIITSCCVENERCHQMVEILFEDTGPGIPTEQMQRIFDPFYTTKVKGHGTGLGLAVSYGIIERHEGTITVQNRPAGGAAFSVRLRIEGKNHE